MRLLLAAVIAVAVAACASIGRPEGGARDEVPPVYVRSNPKPGTLNFDKNNIEIYFDENIKLDDPSNKIVVSPAQQQQPQAFANGRKLTLTLKDTLLPDQTYTLDFSDAIRDLNEGNILDGFVIDFSTGDHLDSLRIAGMVLQAQNLEPAQSIIVGAYRNLADSAIRTIRVERVCKTNQMGEFTLRNLKSEYYRLFAINDVNRDYKWDRSEDIAFYNVPVRPWAENFQVVDTLRAHDDSDSIAYREGVRFFPNDILLTWFNENYMPLYMTDHARDERHIIKLGFSTKVDTLPVLTVVNGENEGRVLSDFARLNRSLNNDTLEYWIEDSALIKQDSLLIATRYLKTDSLENISWTTDTIRFFFRLSRAAEKEIEQKAKEKEEKEKKRQEAIKKWLATGDSTLIADTIPEPEEIPYIEIKTVSSSQDYHKPYQFSFSQPVRSIDEEAVRLEWKEDTIWYPVENFKISQDTNGRIMNYFIKQPWEFETQYRLTIDSAAVQSIYDIVNNKFSHEFKVKSAEEYSTLIFEVPNKPYMPDRKFNWDSLALIVNPPAAHDSIPMDSTVSSVGAIDSVLSDTLNIDADSLGRRVEVDLSTPIDSLHYTRDSLADVGGVLLVPDSIVQLTANDPRPKIIIELLTSSEAVVASQPVVDGRARFDFVTPGTYYARAFIDFNDNGIWDTGSIEEWTQPEDVYYYPKKIELKKNWDMSQTWDIYELPVDVQKPYEIKKNKPKTKEAPPTTEEEEEDDFGNNYFYEGNSYGMGSQYENARRGF